MKVRHCDMIPMLGNSIFILSHHYCHHIAVHLKKILFYNTCLYSYWGFILPILWLHSLSLYFLYFFRVTQILFIFCGGCDETRFILFILQRLNSAIIYDRDFSYNFFGFKVIWLVHHKKYFKSTFGAHI